MWLWQILLLLAGSGAQAKWDDPLGWTEYPDGSDLQHFVTRPEFKAPRYMVAKHHPDAIAPGYWFVTPYTRLGAPPKTRQKDYLPCMSGAHIYDGDGELVWSGSCLYGNRNVFSLRPVNVNGSDYITFYLPRERGIMIKAEDRLPSAVVMNNEYVEISRNVPEGTGLDGHEFFLQPNGLSALMSTRAVRDVDASTLGLPGQGTRRVVSTGFQELDLTTHKAIFDWDPLDHGVLLSDSCDQVNMNGTPDQSPWDFMHTNSVHKDAEGDYLISARHLSAIYKVSGTDGRILWKLGGCYNSSDFAMEEGVAFYWQHHARFQSSNDTHTIVSVFDNESDDADRGDPKGTNPPVGKIIALDTVRMTATMLRRFDCPDQSHQTPALGSLTVLGDDPTHDSVFINWAFQGYFSEYDSQNRLVLEAKFVSDRKRTIRAYKAPFIASPSPSEIVLAVRPVGYLQDEIASTFYVSWNGATEVASWAFYGGETEDDDSFQLLAKVQRRGFETSWMMSGVVKYAYAEAFDIDGTALGRSARTALAPTIDPKFRVTYPALEGVTRGQSDSVEQSIHSSLTAFFQHGPMVSVLEVVFFLIGAGFAVFGFTITVRSTSHRCRRRLGGYNEVSSFDKLESYTD